MEKEMCKFYPKDHINEILKRLNSRDKHIMQSAILEGICYKYFLDKGFKIDVHPVMENNKRPDFKISNEKVAFYLEAVVIAKNINKLVVEKKAEIIKYLNTALVGFKFYVNIIFAKIDLNNELRKKNLKDFIMAKAEEFDISYLVNIEESTLDKYFFKYEDAGWILDVSYIAETDESSKNVVSEIVSTYKAKDDEKYVYKSLKKKVTKYGELDLPYVLATCFYQEDNFLGEKDLIDALLGSRAYNKELNTIRIL